MENARRMPRGVAIRRFHPATFRISLVARKSLDSNGSPARKSYPQQVTPAVASITIEDTFENNCYCQVDGKQSNGNVLAKSFLASWLDSRENYICLLSIGYIGFEFKSNKYSECLQWNVMELWRDQEKQNNFKK